MIALIVAVFALLVGLGIVWIAWTARAEERREEELHKKHDAEVEEAKRRN